MGDTTKVKMKDTLNVNKAMEQLLGWRKNNCSLKGSIAKNALTFAPT